MGIDTQSRNGESDEEGIVDLKVELISALEELEKCRRKNRQSNHVISELETQLLEAKKIEQDLNLQLKRRIHEFERLEEEIMQFKKKLDEESIKLKFENSSRILYEILNRQRPSSNISGLGFNKENNPECFSFTNQGGNKKSYAEALKNPVKKEEGKKSSLNSRDQNINNMVPKRPNRYQEIFLGHCYSCNNFGHKAINCRSYGKFHEYKNN